MHKFTVGDYVIFVGAEKDHERIARESQLYRANG